MYIKDAVTNACPLTVEDLIKKMIDCVQAVPAGYLKPVVEASIKRSQSVDLGGLGEYTVVLENLKTVAIPKRKIIALSISSAAFNRMVLLSNVDNQADT